MKRKLFMLMLAFGSATFVACSNDKDDDGKGESQGSYGKYGWAEYTVAGNDVVQGALYVSWKPKSDTLATDVPMYEGMVRKMGSLLLPQLVKTISLEKDGAIVAEYSDQKVTFELEWMGKTPSASELEKLIPEEGWKTSKDMASWSERNGRLYVKLDVAAIAGDAGGLIAGVLSQSPAEVKVMLKLAGLDLGQVQDEMLATLLEWVKTGIPMQVRQGADGGVRFYLDEEDWKPFLSLRQVEGKDEPASNLMLLGEALVASKLLPAEKAGMINMVFGILTACYNMSDTFHLGVDLKKQ